MAIKTNNRNRSTTAAKSNTKETSSNSLLDGRGRVTGCFYIRDDGSHIEYELATDPPEAVFWTTYKLKPGHIKVVGKYDRKAKSELAKEICNDINAREAKVDKQPVKDKILKKRQAARSKHAETGA